MLIFINEENTCGFPSQFVGMSLDRRCGIVVLAIPDVLLLSAYRFLVAGLRLAALSLSPVN